MWGITGRIHPCRISKFHILVIEGACRGHVFESSYVFWDDSRGVLILSPKSPGT